MCGCIERGHAIVEAGQALVRGEWQTVVSKAEFVATSLGEDLQSSVAAARLKARARMGGLR